MPVPDVWPSPHDRVAEATQYLRWQQFFRDPTLQAQIKTALANNRDLRVAISRVELARSMYRIQRADLFPHLTGDVAPLRGRLPANNILPTGQLVPGVVLPKLPIGQRVISNLYGAFLNASWEIDLWGRVHNLTASALNTWLATDEARRAVTLTLIADVANTWLLGRELDERIALAHRTIKNRLESDRIVRRRFEVGSAPRIDLTQADAQLGQAESELIALEQQREQTRNALTLLMGAPASDEVIKLSSVEHAVVRDLPPGLPSDILEKRPDIRGAEDRLRAAEADIGAARAAFFPRIDLLGIYGTASTAFKKLFSGDNGAWLYGANAVMPLFEGGSLMGNLAGAKAMRIMAVADYGQTVQKAFRDVSDALAARHWLKKQVKAEGRTLVALAERTRLANLRYRTGSSTYLEVLEAQRDLFDAEQKLVETRRARLSSEVNLYAALGGGDDDPSCAMAICIQKKTGGFP